MVAVSGYVKRDGTQVRAHSRSAPGSRRELSVLALTVVAVMALGSGGGGSAAQGSGGSRPAGKLEAPVFRITFPTGKPVAPDLQGGDR